MEWNGDILSASALERQGRWAEEEEIRTILLNIIRRVVGDFDLRDDLMQEALIHLAEEEEKYPGQTRSWYIQSCRYHILHRLKRGCSVDSVKRRGAQSIAMDQLFLTDWLDERFIVEESPLDFASAEDLLRRLYPSLTHVQTTILEYLVDGFGAREIARKLDISHQAVSKHRQQIAFVAIELGFSRRSS
jgi:RNA polymerase sigma factor (sigma-70 family)